MADWVALIFAAFAILTPMPVGDPLLLLGLFGVKTLYCCDGSRVRIVIIIAVHVFIDIADSYKGITWLLRIQGIIVCGIVEGQIVTSSLNALVQINQCSNLCKNVFVDLKLKNRSGFGLCFWFGFSILFCIKLIIKTFLDFGFYFFGLRFQNLDLYGLCFWWKKVNFRWKNVFQLNY